METSMYLNKLYPHIHAISANRERIAVPAIKQDRPTGPFRLLATKINRLGAAADGTTKVIPARSRPLTAQAAGVTPLESARSQQDV